MSHNENALFGDGVRQSKRIKMRQAGWLWGCAGSGCSGSALDSPAPRLWPALQCWEVGPSAAGPLTTELRKGREDHLKWIERCKRERALEGPLSAAAAELRPSQLVHSTPPGAAPEQRQSAGFSSDMPGKRKWEQEVVEEGGGTTVKRNKGGQALCPHQRLKYNCKQCGGAGRCPHQRRKNACTERGG